MNLEPKPTKPLDLEGLIKIINEHDTVVSYKNCKSGSVYIYTETVGVFRYADHPSKDLEKANAITAWLPLDINVHQARAIVAKSIAKFKINSKEEK